MNPRLGLFIIKHLYWEPYLRDTTPPRRVYGANFCPKPINFHASITFEDLTLLFQSMYPLESS